jgi:aerobic-type carbon monoxide dehydrogenase small subunit (CoxS/CutS family)
MKEAKSAMPSPAPIIGQVVVDDQQVDILEGDTLGSCLMRAEVLAMRRSRSGQLRGLYCAIGVCHDCLVTVDGVPNVRACMTLALPKAKVETERIAP